MGIAMRSIMRQVPSTVAVLTAYTEHEGTPLPLGSAISSLTTVTLDPLHISFNLKTPSRTLDAIRAAQGRFRVHLLDNTQQAADIAHDFTQGNSLDTLRRRSEAFAFKYPVWNEVQQPPKLWYDCVMAIMTCQLEQEVAVQDHVIAVASVQALEAKTQQVPALLYHQGEFRTRQYYASGVVDGKKDEESSTACGAEEGEKSRKPNDNPVYVYEKNTDEGFQLIGHFVSPRRAAKFLGESGSTVVKHMQGGQVFKDRYRFLSKGAMEKTEGTAEKKRQQELREKKGNDGQEENREAGQGAMEE